MITKTYTMVEIWKDIKGCEGCYQISSMGRVKSLSRRIAKKGQNDCITKERILKTFQLKGGYINVMLRCNGKSVNHNVHRLVAEAFIPNNNPNFDCINHKDGNKANNRISNLEWCNHSINCLHAYDNGISHKSGKLSDLQVREVRKLLEQGQRCVDIARKYGVHLNIISNIKCGYTYQRVL